MNKTDAKAYRQAAELIASGKQEFCCCALEFEEDNRGMKGVGRPDLANPFKEAFWPSKKKGGDYYVFWNESAEKNCPTKTKSREHSRECRIFALLFMAEMIENP